MIFDELWRVERRARKAKELLGKKYHPLIEAARKAGNQDEHDRLRDEYFMELNLIDGPDVIRTARLVKRARRLAIPLPPKPDYESEDLFDNKDWNVNPTTYSFTLTEAAELSIRQQIRKEEMESFEHRMRRLNLGIVPIIGAAMGLISLLHALFWK